MFLVTDKPPEGSLAALVLQCLVSSSYLVKTKEGFKEGVSGEHHVGPPVDDE